MMKKIFALMLVLAFMLVFVACGDDSSGDGASNGTSGNNVVSSTDKSEKPGEDDKTDESNKPVVNSSIPDTPPEDDRPIGPGEDDEPDDPSVPSGPNDKDEPELDTKKETVVDALGSSLKVFEAADTFGNEGQISKFTSYTAEYNLSTLSAGQRVTIKSGGTYRITGKNLNSQIFIQAKDAHVIILLDGVDLTSTTSVPAIYAEDCASVTIVLAENM